MNKEYEVKIDYVFKNERGEESILTNCKFWSYGDSPYNAVLKLTQWFENCEMNPKIIRILSVKVKKEVM